MEDAVQGLREVAATMGAGEEDDGGDGVDHVLEHWVNLALEICLVRTWNVSSWKFTCGIDGSLPLLQSDPPYSVRQILSVADTGFKSVSIET